MSKKKNCLLIIDCQNDFCNPNGSLYVKNAENVCIKIKEFIEANKTEINDIIVSLDTHYPLNISNNTYWVNANHNNPLPFSEINADFFQEYKPLGDKVKVKRYIDYLNANDLMFILWPEHCIINTNGWLLNKDIVDGLNEWNKATHHTCHIKMKGLEEYTDQYSVFRPVMATNHIKIDYKLINKFLKKNYNFFICGVATDVCVRNTVKDLCTYIDNDCFKNIILLEDCMSAINPSFNIKTDPVYVNAVKKGAKIVSSTEFNI